jgi:phosphate transport system protein
MAMSTGSRSVLEHEFAAMRDDVLRLGSLVDMATERALQALDQRNLDLARQLIVDDVVINDLRFKVEQQCLVTIATQQPAAGDLRVVIATMNVVTDLERMADHATGIAKTVLRMGDEPPLSIPRDIFQMGDKVREMLRQSLDAFLARDPEAARVVAARDDEIDHLYKSVFDTLLHMMIDDPPSATRATYFLWTAHSLERMGDRVTNIAERVIFMMTGDMKELNV